MKRELRTITILVFTLTIAFTIFALSNVATSRTNRSSRAIQAVLQCQSKRWDGKHKLNLIFYIINNSSAPISLDGRFSWPGNVDLIAKLPSGEVKNISSILVKMSLPKKSDMIFLRPGGLFGQKLSIDVSNSGIIKEIRKPAHGKYAIWGTYYSPGLFGKKSITLTTNKVEFEVR